MLLMLLPIVVYLFLLAGAIAFTVCGLFPWLRKFALSTALWFATLGPCVLGWMGITGWAIVMRAFVADQSDEPALRIPALHALGKLAGYEWLAAGVLGSILIATFAACLHQWLIRRFTHDLFRLYVTVVLAGIGSVLGWAVGCWVAVKIDSTGYTWGFAIWLTAMLGLVAGFGYAGWRWARHLRGKAPERFTWLSREEFEGAS